MVAHQQPSDTWHLFFQDLTLEPAGVYMVQSHLSGERAPGASQCCAMHVALASCERAHWARWVLSALASDNSCLG